MIFIKTEVQPNIHDLTFSIFNLDLQRYPPFLFYFIYISAPMAALFSMLCSCLCTCIVFCLVPTALSIYLPQLNFTAIPASLVTSYKSLELKQAYLISPFFIIYSYLIFVKIFWYCFCTPTTIKVFVFYFCHHIQLALSHVLTLSWSLSLARTQTILDESKDSAAKGIEYNLCDSRGRF